MKGVNEIDKDYKEIENILKNNKKIKQELELNKNKIDLDTYYKVGKILYKNKDVLNNYSKLLTKELGIGYSIRNLNNMIMFYIKNKTNKEINYNISWSLYTEIIHLSDKEYKYYYNLLKDNKYTVRSLRKIIK